MKITIITLLSLLSLVWVGAEEYCLVEISLDDYLAQDEPFGFSTECISHESVGLSKSIKVPLTDKDIAKLNENKIHYRIVVENLSEFYAKRAAEDDLELVEVLRKELNTEMKLGSMGGYFTLEEVNLNLDYLYEKYKEKGLITEKLSIGKTSEGRDIFMVKISDNASKDEEISEPQVMYTSAHHSCEPAGLMTVFYFMYYLLENYDSDQRVKNIVDNRELFFIPLVNPDGYAYNQKTNPKGGGLWRKNRNGQGVDLNRNYGPLHFWDYSNNGSSSDPEDFTYRGTAPFSENETQAIRQFVSDKNIRINLNYHAFGSALFYPWAHKDEIAHPECVSLAKELTLINGYKIGSSDKMLYPIRGDADDWMFWQHQILSMTPEVGDWWDGFWPSPSRIFLLAKKNVDANLLLAEYAEKIQTK